MRLPDTPEMKQIWNEIAPFLKITLKENEKEKIYNICRRRTIRDCPTKIQDL